MKKNKKPIIIGVIIISIVLFVAGILLWDLDGKNKEKQSTESHKVPMTQGGFSEGQLQRLSIARALPANAPVLLLDEATSALDMETEEQLIRNLMEARRNYTCIITTHRPSVLRICDRIYRVENGKIGGDL